MRCTDPWTWTWTWTWTWNSNYFLNLTIFIFLTCKIYFFEVKTSLFVCLYVCLIDLVHLKLYTALYKYRVAANCTELVRIEWQSAVKNRNETSQCIWQDESGACLNVTDDEFMTDGRKVESVGFMYKIGLCVWTGTEYNLIFLLHYTWRVDFLPLRMHNHTHIHMYNHNELNVLA